MDIYLVVKGIGCSRDCEFHVAKDRCGEIAVKLWHALEVRLPTAFDSAVATCD